MTIEVKGVIALIATLGYIAALIITYIKAKAEGDACIELTMFFSLIAYSFIYAIFWIIWLLIF